MGSYLAPARGSARVLLAVALLFGFTVTLTNPERAHAYCRESTTSSPGGDCQNDANSVLLYWGRNCMTYVFNRSVFSRVPDGEAFVRRTFETSYQSWANVSCGTGSNAGVPFLVAQASGSTTTNDSQFLYDEPNESIVVVRDENEWSSLADHDALALALTLIWHDKKSGEILDVDMELNGGAGSFSDCRTERCGNSNIDLQNTITHEAGHLLGLGHTTVRGATMAPSTTMSPETEKRDLAPDDTEGYCALDLPAGPCEGSSCTCPAPPVYSSQRRVTTCSCRTLGAAAQGGPAWGAGLAALVLGTVWLRRRGRRP
jgi:hypothetical protein